MGYGIDSLDKGAGVKKRADDADIDAPFIKKFWLRKGESAEVQFLVETDKIYTDWVHSIKRSYKAKDGTTRPFWTKDICTFKSDGKCEYCERSDEKEKKATPAFYAWLLVQKITRVENEADATPVKVGKATVYEVEPNEIMVWENGVGKDRYILAAIATANIAFKRTIMNRRFLISRGESYTIMPLDAEPLPGDITASLDKLPLLGLVAEGKVTKLVLSDNPKKLEKKEAKAVSIDAEDLEEDDLTPDDTGVDMDDDELKQMLGVE